MNVNRFSTHSVLSFFAVLFIGHASAYASTARELSRCLSSAASREHRIEKEASIRTCFNEHKTSVSKETCYLSLAQQTLKLASISTQLTEEIKSICFYETTPAKDINICLNEAKKFKTTNNHDEAVFYCHQLFQENLTKKDCLKTANQLIYPLKKEYLKQYCYRN